MKLALCLLTWNEIDGVKHDILKLDRSKFEQIYCIDGGSTDGTIEFLTGENIPVYLQTKKGLNQACLDGVMLCECDAVVFYHPKGTIPVSDTYKFRDYYNQGYEFIVGSRMMAGSLNEEDSKFLKPRKWFVLGLGLLARIFFHREGNVIWDTLHGFRGMTVEAFNRLDISSHPCSIDLEMVIRSYKYKIKRIEFPTQERPRIGGETHFKAFSTGWKLLKFFWWELWRKN